MKTMTNKNWIKQEIIKCYNENFKDKTSLELFQLYFKSNIEIYKDLEDEIKVWYNSYTDSAEVSNGLWLHLSIKQDNLLNYFDINKLNDDIEYSVLDYLIRESSLYDLHLRLKQEHEDRIYRLNNFVIYYQYTDWTEWINDLKEHGIDVDVDHYSEYCKYIDEKEYRIERQQKILHKQLKKTKK